MTGFSAQPEPRDRAILERLRDGVEVTYDAQREAERITTLRVGIAHRRRNRRLCWAANGTTAAVSLAGTALMLWQPYDPHRFAIGFEWLAAGAVTWLAGVCVLALVALGVDLWRGVRS